MPVLKKVNRLYLNISLSHTFIGAMYKGLLAPGQCDQKNRQMSIKVAQK